MLPTAAKHMATAPQAASMEGSQRRGPRAMQTMLAGICAR